MRKTTQYELENIGLLILICVLVLFADSIAELGAEAIANLFDLSERTAK